VLTARASRARSGEVEPVRAGSGQLASPSADRLQIRSSFLLFFQQARHDHPLFTTAVLLNATESQSPSRIFCNHFAPVLKGACNPRLAVNAIGLFVIRKRNALFSPKNTTYVFI